MDSVHKLGVSASEELDRYEILKEVSHSTSLSPHTIVSWSSLVFVLCYVLNVGPSLLTTLVGTAYPLYASCMVFKGTNNRTNASHWVLYWVLYAFFVIVEGLFIHHVLIWFPFYYAFKLGFLIWCQSPTTRGSMFIYIHLLAPFLKKHECEFDHTED